MMNTFSLVFPVYNEEERLPWLFEELTHPFFESAELIFVDDASCDNTLTTLREQQQKNERLLIVHHKERQGQHVALLTGMALAGEQKIALADADAQWKLDLLPEMLHLLSKADIVLSYRKQRESLWRKTASFLFNQVVVRTLFRVPARDIGSPVKVFSKSQAKAILKAGGFFRFLPEMRKLQIAEVELAAHSERKKKSHYSFLNLLSLCWQTLYPPVLRPAQGEEIAIFRNGVVSSSRRGRGRQ